MNAMDEFFRKSEALKRKQEKRIEEQRDGTPEGELKAEYLEQVFLRMRLRLGLKILSDEKVPEALLEEKRRDIAETTARIVELETKLDRAGIRVRKVRR